MKLAVPLIVLALFGCRDAHAGCNLIPEPNQTFRSSVGSVNRPFATPGDKSLQIVVRPRPNGCDASPGVPETGNVVVVVFTPPTGPRNAVILMPSCAGFDPTGCLANLKGDLGDSTATCMETSFTTLGVCEGGQKAGLACATDGDCPVSPASSQPTKCVPHS